MQKDKSNRDGLGTPDAAATNALTKFLASKAVGMSSVPM